MSRTPPSGSSCVQVLHADIVCVIAGCLALGYHVVPAASPSLQPLLFVPVPKVRSSIVLLNLMVQFLVRQTLLGYGTIQETIASCAIVAIDTAG